MNEKKRLYVGGLFPDVKEEQLKEKFAKFGELTAVEIKTKSSVQDGQPNTFAFIDINITPSNLVKCFSVFSNCRWKGHEIKLQVAKESFLQRLKKEKEGFCATKTNNPNFEPIKNDKWVKLADKPDNNLNSKVDVKPTVKALPTVNKLGNLSKTRSNGDLPKKLPVVDVVEKTMDVVERLEMFSGNVWGDKSYKKTKSIDRSTLSNVTRLKSIEEKLKDAKAKDQLISNALKMGINGKSNNKKINFDCDDEESADSVKTERKAIKIKSKMKRKTLFDDDLEDNDEEGENYFNLKPQFDGQSGEQLLELQTRYGNDKRFRLDERFTEIENDASDEIENEKSLQLERNRNLEILEDIVGEPVRLRKKKNEKQTFMMKRYDPTKADCVNLEVTRNKVDKPSKIDVQSESEVTTADVDNTDVSTERFYEVKTNLADLFNKGKKQDSSFSVLKKFGTTSLPKAKLNERPKAVSNNVRTSWGRNPFFYDSSSEDEDTEELKPEQNHSSADVPKRSTFFFSNSDSRLKDGLAFYRNNGDPKKDSNEWICAKGRATELIKASRRIFKKKRRSQQITIKKKKKISVSRHRKKFKKSKA